MACRSALVVVMGKLLLLCTIERSLEIVITLAEEGAGLPLVLGRKKVLLKYPFSATPFSLVNLHIVLMLSQNKLD